MFKDTHFLQVLLLKFQLYVLMTAASNMWTTTAGQEFKSQHSMALQSQLVCLKCNKLNFCWSAKFFCLLPLSFWVRKRGFPIISGSFNCYIFGLLTAMFYCWHLEDFIQKSLLVRRLKHPPILVDCCTLNYLGLTKQGNTQLSGKCDAPLGTNQISWWPRVWPMSTDDMLNTNVTI